MRRWLWRARLSRMVRLGLLVVLLVVLTRALTTYVPQTSLLLFCVRAEPKLYVVPQHLVLAPVRGERGMSLVRNGWEMHVPWPRVEGETVKTLRGSEIRLLKLDFERGRRLTITLDAIAWPDWRALHHCRSSDEMRARCEHYGGPRALESPFFLTRALMTEVPSGPPTWIFQDALARQSRLYMKLLFTPGYDAHVVWDFDNGNGYGFQIGSPALDDTISVVAHAPDDRYLEFRLHAREGFPPIEQREVNVILATLRPTADAPRARYLYADLAG